MADAIFTRTLIAFTKIDEQQKKILAKLINELIIAMSNGHSCLNVEDYLLTKNHEDNLSLHSLMEILDKSNICDFYRDDEKYYSKPLILMHIKNVDTMLYFNRYYQYERNIAIKINSLLSTSNLIFNDIDSEIVTLQMNLPNNLPNKNQIEAIKESAKHKFSIITGGPGTGKTTTIFLLILILLRLYKTKLKIAIIAPTGKAVLRANESVLNSLNLLVSNITINNTEMDIINNIQYKTIHKLLGYMNLSNNFKYNKDNQLDYDIIIVDESSMVSLNLYNNLLLAINEKEIKHLIFLGDRNQLSSVEEGHVFSDLIKYYLANINLLSRDIIAKISVSFLEESNRNDKNIAILASAILNEDINQLLQIINNSDKICLKKCELAVLMRDLFAKNGFLYNYVELIKQKKDVKDLFSYLNQFSILCNKNVGTMGVDNINNIIDSLIKDLLDCQDIWYLGRTIIILENNQGLGLVNGDIGICIMDSDGYKIAFNNGKKLSLQLLPKFSLAYAITIHKSQGSEYKHVMVILDDYSNNMLSKELIYTAITRAKQYVNIYAEKNSLLKSIQKNVIRHSGLYYFLQK